ncbi:hypothetical protein [Paraglaciecola arctica]|uniref:hypothetical protein n=1 Tax=Paraglaciecola arctica TaxID=1128911 RepID=UPI001C0791F3|nr:hypothetical protein [Paraglaciecola arctica]MBU3006010.1 hypothetical protein [Paraglaciecola arctica]
MTELERFARWFHQDFGVIYASSKEGAQVYLSTLDSKNRDKLASEISQLFIQNPGKDFKGLKNAWLRMGAQWWDSSTVPELLVSICNGNFSNDI